MIQVELIRPYWPMIAAALGFLLLGLWWRLAAARAMEGAPKPLSWVQRYRAGGFPFRKELMGPRKLHWPALLGALGLGAVLYLPRLINAGLLPAGQILWPLLLLRALGAGAVYVLLEELFGSPWVGLPGAALFAASPAPGHEASCFLALSLLLLLWYLRAEKPGFPAELLYPGALLFLAAGAALVPGLLWTLPCFPAAHWAKLLSQRRERRLSGGGLVLALLLALVGLALALCLLTVLALSPTAGFQGANLRLLTWPNQLWIEVQALIWRLPGLLIVWPAWDMLPALLRDGALLGFGLWGCVSAWVLARRRRDVRGVVALVLPAVLLAAWLLSGQYALTLGLVFPTACILRDSDLGKQRALPLVMTLLGLAWSVSVPLLYPL